MRVSMQTETGAAYRPGFVRAILPNAENEDEGNVGDTKLVVVSWFSSLAIK